MQRYHFSVILNNTYIKILGLNISLLNCIIYSFIGSLGYIVNLLFMSFCKSLILSITFKNYSVLLSISLSSILGLEILASNRKLKSGRGGAYGGTGIWGGVLLYSSWLINS